MKNRFRAFFEQSVLPMEIYDLEGHPLEVNDAWLELFGTTRGELGGYNILTDHNSKEMGMVPYLKRAYAGEAVEMPAIYVDPKKLGKRGRPRWVEAWFTPVKDDENKVVELAIILKDVTIRKEVQEELKRTQERLNMAIKTGQVGVWEWKMGQQNLSWDETLEGFYGYAPGTFPGHLDDYLKHIHPDDKEKLWNTVEESQRLMRSYVIEHRIIRLDGQIRWVQCSGATLFDENKQASIMMGTSIDITEKKVAALDQEFLAKTSEIFSKSFNIIENLQEFGELAINYFCDCCVVDQLLPDGQIKRILVSSKNHKIKELLFKIHEDFPDRYSAGYPLFEALITGKTIFAEKSDEVKKQFQDKKPEKYFKDFDKIEMQGHIISRLKGRENLLGTISFFSHVGSSFRLDASHKYVAEEIAFRVGMAIENSLLFKNAQEAIKARDEFLSIASHELKTPLTSLTLQNQMRLRQLDKGDRSVLSEVKFRQMIVADDHQLKRINHLINDMLDIARIKGSRLTIFKEIFNFCPYVDEVVERFRPQLQLAGCEMTLTNCSQAVVEADKFRIEQVIMNLLTNAMKYGSRSPIKIEVVVHPHKVCFKVHDKGPGIAANDLDRIFLRFERAVGGANISGLGLGLYISRQIVEQHEGTLFATSQLSQGSTFIMELPLVE